MEEVAGKLDGPRRYTPKDDGAAAESDTDRRSGIDEGSLLAGLRFMGTDDLTGRLTLQVGEMMNRSGFPGRGEAGARPGPRLQDRPIYHDLWNEVVGLHYLWAKYGPSFWSAE